MTIKIKAFFKFKFKQRKEGREERKNEKMKPVLLGKILILTEIRSISSISLLLVQNSNGHTATPTSGTCFKAINAAK